MLLSNSFNVYYIIILGCIEIQNLFYFVLVGV